MSSVNPRIAVVIPCFNDGLLLVEAIASVDEREPVEIVVADDCSTEAETLTIIDRLITEGLTVVRHEQNRGTAETRTDGARAARAPYVFPLDADDLAVPGALARMADRLDAAPDAIVCYGDYLEFGAHELVRAVPPSVDPYRVAYANEYPVSALFRRTFLEAVGGWTAPRRAYEDWSLWMTVAERRVPSVYLGPGELSFKKRFHGERLLNRAKREHRDLYRELQALHPQLFSEIRHHRERSDLPLRRKILYPILHGGRHRFAFERHAKRWLDKAGVWTLRR